MFGDIHIAACRLHAFAAHGVIQRFVAIFRTPDGLHVLLGLALQPLAREGQIAHGNAQCVVVAHLLVQFMAVAAGDVGKDGNDVLFLRRFIDNHLVAQCVQLTDQQLVGDVDRLRAAHIVHRPLDDVFAIVGNVQDAAVGQHRAHPGNRRRLNISTLHTQLRQRLFDRRAIGMRRAGKRGCQQSEHQ